MSCQSVSLLSPPLNLLRRLLHFLAVSVDGAVETHSKPQPSSLNHIPACTGDKPTFLLECWSDMGTSRGRRRQLQCYNAFRLDLNTEPPRGPIHVKSVVCPACSSEVRYLLLFCRQLGLLQRHFFRGQLLIKLIFCL